MDTIYPIIYTLHIDYTVFNSSIILLIPITILRCAIPPLRLAGLNHIRFSILISSSTSFLVFLFFNATNAAIATPTKRKHPTAAPITIEVVLPAVFTRLVVALPLRPAASDGNIKRKQVINTHYHNEILIL